MNNTNLIVISIVIAFGLIVASFILSGENTRNLSEGEVAKLGLSNDPSEIIITAPGTTHEHMSILIFMDGDVVDLKQRRYMLRDESVHLEDDDGFVIHKHAKGVTLTYFFSTLGIDITENCITFDTGRQYCNSQSSDKVLSIIINGDRVDDPNTYELANLDKILINYGDDKDTDLRFKFNNIPAIPPGLL